MGGVLFTWSCWPFCFCFRYAALILFSKFGVLQVDFLPLLWCVCVCVCAGDGGGMHARAQLYPSNFNRDRGCLDLTVLGSLKNRCPT